MNLLEEIFVEGYEKVYKVEDPEVGLKAIICLHNLSLGLGLGGTRIYPYENFEQALVDVKRLAEGMTYKSALAGCPWGGAKSVIIASREQKTPALLRSFGRAVEKLGGVYICAEDVGSTPDDMKIIGEETKYVVGLPDEKSSGNPSYFTAWGVYRGIQSGLKTLYGNESVKGRTVAIQGLGSVGSILAGILFWQGAKLIVADIDEEKVDRIVQQYAAKRSSVDAIYEEECDVFSPCALGGGISERNIERMRVQLIAGAANNQLLVEEDAERLFHKGILYAPDFVINAGGLINVTEELMPEGYCPAHSRDRVDTLYEQLLYVFNVAKERSISTYRAAKAIGEERVEKGIGRRSDVPCFHRALVGV